MKRLLISVSALALMSGAAFAADPILPPPADIYIPEATGMSWTGAYVGVNVGYAFGDAEAFDGDIGYGSEDLSGWLGGVQAGYNVQFDNVVVGVEADLAWADVSVEDEDGFIGDDVSANWIGTVRGRLGFAAENFLIYGTAGVAFAGIDYDDEDLDSDTFVGWVAGVGAEVKVTDSISLKGEYLYHSFNDQDIYEDSDYEADANVQTVKVGLNFHF